MEEITTPNHNSNIAKENYKVLGMTCAACAISLETYLAPFNGILNVLVNYPNQSIEVVYNADKVSIETIQQKAKEIGYEILIGKHLFPNWKNTIAD